MNSIKKLSFGIFILALIFYSFSKSTETKFPIPKLTFFPIPPEGSLDIRLNEFELGKKLFYDPILSRDSTFSCASCHKQEFAFSDGGKKFSPGIDGILTHRNAMPLFNLAWQSSFFWDGRARTLSNQAIEPLQNKKEMDLDWITAVKRIKEHSSYSLKFKEVYPNKEIDSLLITYVIGQFEKAIISNNSKFDKSLIGELYLSKKELLGFELINDQSKGNCLHCHTTDSDVLGTTGEIKNNGLDLAFFPEDFKDAGLGGITNRNEDYGKFKIPSLRNLGFTAPYMHDGRFNTLKEVLKFYTKPNNSFTIDKKMEIHKGGANLNEEEIDAILSFLETLNDSNLVSNPLFANPHP